MNSILSGLAGAAALALAYGLVIVWRKAGKTAGALVEAFHGIPQLVKSNLEVTAALHRFSGELEFLRTAMIGGTPPEAAPEAGEAAPAPRTPSGKPLPQFPTWQPYVAAVADVPDAEIGDTEVLEQDDAALVEQEQLDEIRGQGFAAGPEADPMHNPPGVEASV
jgi:hypothetical protein